MRAMRELAEVHAALPEDRAVSLDEAIEVHRRLVSRRGFLQAAGALGVSAAIVSWPIAAAARPTRRARTDPRVVIVGAGLAGVSCAWKLRLHGIATTLYDARDRVGGRCWTARGFADRQTAEHGGEFIDTRHVQLRRLVARLGLELDDLWAAYDALGPTSGLLVLDGEQRDRREVFAEMDVVVRRLTREARRIGPYRFGQAGPAAKAFDQRTMRELMDEIVPGGSGSLLGRAIDVGQTGFWGIDPESTSAITMIDAYVTPYPGGPADERYHVRGGNDQVPTMLAEMLPPGAVHLEAPLVAMWRRTDGSYALRFGDSAATVVADHVVLCLPFTALREVELEGAGFDAKRLRSIRELGMGTNAKLLLQLRDRLHSFDDWSGSFSTDQPKSDSWASTLEQPGNGDVLTVFSGGATGASYPTDVPHGPAPAVVVDEALGFLDRWLPGTRASFNGRAWLDSWVDDPWTRGSYAAFLPGQWTSFFGYLGLSQGNVHFAGEHTSTYSQGYLNGGVETGLRAAREILHAVGRRVA